MARHHSAAAIVGRAVGLPLSLALLGLWLKWPAIARFHADQTSGDVALTVYTRDVSPGGTLDAYVRVDGGERAALGTIVVRGAGDDQRIPGSAVTWGGKIKGGSGEASTNTDFEIAVPETVAPGPLQLEIEVHFIEAHANPIDKTFINGRSHETFTYEVMVTTPAWTAAFRIGRVLLALGSWVGVVWLLVWLARTFARRELTPSPLWLVLVVPYAYIGYIWFAHQLTIATG
jgi:hypothetical protein